MSSIILFSAPYGVREPAEKIGIEQDDYTLSDEHLVNHVPSKVEYGLSQIYGDLLNFSAKHLKIGRRLVCWYPLVRQVVFTYYVFDLLLISL